MSQAGNIIIRLRTETRTLYQLQSPAEEGYVVGRSDDSSDFIPDIDLATMGAREMGVSRRHAALIRYKNMPHILDLHSINGTFLNGRRLLPDIPYALALENDVRLGTLQLAVYWTQ